ncbi:heavy metal translocating P-type ATPase [Chitinibacteraceae bacterium HSL-7]
MSQACFHCGEPVPGGVDLPVRYREHPQPTCCTGCQTVAQSIIDAGLASYYEQRERPAPRSEPLPAELTERLRLYDSPELQQGFVTAAGDEREATLMIEGIVCAACVWLNERAIVRLPGVLDIHINYSTHRARVRWDSTRVSLSVILEAVAALGYRAEPYDHDRLEASQQKQTRQQLIRLWVAGLSMMQVMMFVVPIYMAEPGEIDAQWLTLMHWASAILTLPVVVYSAWPFYVSSWRDLRRGRTGMDLPVSIGVLAAFFASLYALITDHGEIWFDSVSMFVFLLLGGRYLEARARRRAGAALENLVKLVPSFTHRFDSWPERSPSEATVASLQAGHVILVRPGESVPADGVVLEGESATNEALLTGESAAVTKHPGSDVVAGTVNQHSPLIVEVRSVGEQTRLAAIVRLLDRALAEKPRAALLADRIAGWFVAILLLVAAGTYWWWTGADPLHALPITVAVLVISCPCALSLATPAALTAATGQLAQRGVLITRGHALSVMPKLTDVIFDKTGTLTAGQPEVVRAEFAQGDEPFARQIAAALEAHSEHALARALQRDDAPTATEVQNHPGGGLSGVVDGTRYWIGSPAFVSSATGLPPLLISDQCTQVALASTTHWLARFGFADPIRAEAQRAILALQQQGIRVHLVSGDHTAAAEDVASQLGIELVRGSASPEDKLAYLDELQQTGHCVAMVGDGINDAPVLARANVSFAMGSATDVSQNCGDVVLFDNQLTRLPESLDTARATRRIVRQNLWWALGYNVVALPLAVCGLVTPWLASAGMAASSLIVVGNALRLTWKRS